MKDANIDPIGTGSGLSDETLDASMVFAARGEGDGAREAAVASLAKGALLGRYVVSRTLGAGAMGTVYLCYDPELDRRVALKLLRRGNSEGRRRALLREAQAMAKLTHPNVVTVYDVGEHAGQVYLAMELVEGSTLRAWLDERPRHWRDVVATVLLAGRGLAAAHARHLIHRDFKPDNVMVSPDGGVRVLDFGLARGGTIMIDQEGRDMHTASGSLLMEAAPGEIAGTPGYMAPEQAMANVPSPAVDQFAFCVSLWEAVVGARPFRGDSYGELLGNIVAGRVQPLPAGARMPRWLKRALLRGLDASPEDRWPSMEALLGALERGRRRWRWTVAVAVLLTVALPIALLAAHRQRRAHAHAAAVAECEAQGAQIDEVWNDEARERLRAGLLSTGTSFAQSSVDTLVPWLDDYQRTWKAGRTEACLLESVRHEWDAQRLDRSAWCFEDRRLQLEATVGQIAGLDANAARRSVRLASYLDPVETCLDPKLLERLPAPPPSIRDEIRSIHGTLVASDKLRHGGQFAAALELANEARMRADTLGWAPLLATARLIEGRCLLEAGRLTEAEPILTRTYFEAQGAGSTEVAFRAARSLLNTLSKLQRHSEAETWAQHAQVLASGMSDPGGLDAAEGHYLLLEVYLGKGDLKAAAEQGEQALAQRQAVLGRNHPLTAAVLRSLGRVYLAQGRPQDALEMFEESFEIWEAAAGHAHPYIGDLLRLRASALLAMGAPQEALGLAREGLAVHEATLRADSPRLATDLDTLGEVLTALGQLQEAERVQQRAVALRRRRALTEP